jgi:outer membrane biosynthesis protein TonB
VLSVPREAPRAPAVPQPPVPKPVPRASPERQPVIALAKPTPEAPAAPQPPAATPQPPARPPAGDLSSYIEARRQARGDPAPPSVESAARAPSAEDENQRANRIAAANVGADRRPSFGTDPSRSGGMFSIQRLTLDYAEFLFYGWNRDINRNTSQLIEVRRGDAPDIRIAVVRRMIAIIRQYEQEDFLWESRRLGRYITLSARQRDNAGLEEFMMREFFEAETRLR